MRRAVGGLWLLVALLLGRWGLDPITVAAPLAATCTPRPPVSVSVAANGPGTLLATIGAATSAGVTLQQVTFGRVTNALIDVPGRSPRDPQPAPIDVTGQSATSFTFQPATAGQAVSIVLTVTDSCGAWPTFVGGGAGVFAASTPTTGPAPTASATTPPAPSATRTLTVAPVATATPTRTPTASPTVKAGAIVTADLGANQQVIGGQTISVYWNGIVNAGVKDQIGLYRTGDTLPQNDRLETPVFTGGAPSGNARVIITNEALVAGLQSDTFQFILYHADVNTPTPAFVTQSQPFTVVLNTVASPGGGAGPALPVKAPGTKLAGVAGASGKSARAGKAAGAPAPGTVRGGAAALLPPAPPPGPPTPTTTPITGNDAFAAALLVSKLPATLAQSTTAATTEGPEPTTCGSAPFGKTVWYKVVPGAGTLTVDTYGSDFDTVLAVYTSPAGTLGGLSLVGCNDEGAASNHQSRVTVNTTGGTTYYVQAGGYASAAGNLIVHLSRGAPANDSFGAAIPLGAPVTMTANTDSATSDAGEPTYVACIDIATLPACPRTPTGIGQTVWYAYTPSATQVLTIDTFGSTFDTVLAVYTGSTLPSLALLIYDDDSGVTQQSRVAFTAAGGTTYYVQVGGFAGANVNGGGTLGSTDAGDLVVHFNVAAAPANDNFAQALPVSLGSHVAAMNALATTEANEPPDCNGAALAHTVWYTLSPTPAAGTVVTLDMFGSTFDTVLAVYSGSGLGNLSQEACSDDSGDVRASQLAFISDGVSTYHIQAGGFTNGGSVAQFGNVILNVGGTPNDDLESAYEAQGLSESKPMTFTQITTNAGTQSGEAATLPAGCGGVAIGKTVWYRVTLPVAAPVVVDTFGSDFDTVLAVYTSANGRIGGLSAPLTCNDNALSTIQSQVQFPAAAFTSYYVQASGKGSGVSAAAGNLIVNFGLGKPANDDFANALDVSPFLNQFSEVFGTATLGATTEGGEPTPNCSSPLAGGIGSTVWFKLSSPSDKTVVIHTNFSNFDTLIATYTGSSLGGLTRIGCNDDAFGGIQSGLQLNMLANTQYYVQVGGTQQSFGSDFGILYATFVNQPPPNDNFALAQAVPGAGGQVRRMFTGTATTQPGEPTANFCDGATRPTGNTVWYSYQPGSRPVTISTFGSDFDTVLAVYTGSAVGNLALIGCDDNSGNTPQSQVSFQGTAGTTYYVQVGGIVDALVVASGSAVINFN